MATLTNVISNATGNVGIGTTSTDTKLQVYSTTGTAQIFNQLQLTNMGGGNNGDIVGIGFAAGESTQYGVKGSIGFVRTTSYGRGDITFYTNNTAGTETVSTSNERMRIDSGGNVGIGTTTPFGTNANRTVLSVNGTTDVSLNIGSGGSQRAYLYGVSSYAELGTIGSLPLRFAPNNSEKMRLDVNGNLGIGTTSPSSPLAVQSNANQLRLQTQDAPTTIFAVIGARYDTSHPFTIEVANNNSTTVEFMGVYADGGGIDNRVVFPTGNVGIGTSSPSTKLQVNFGDVAGNLVNLVGDGATNGSAIATNWITGDSYFDIRLGGTTSTYTKLRIKNDGNVGIGTTSPASKLHVSGSGQTVIRVEASTTTNVAVFAAKADTDAALIMGMYGGSGVGNQFGVSAARQAFIGTTSYSTVHPTSLVIGNISNIPIAFSTDNTERMRITSDGNVGIGTTSPLQKLHVLGNISTISQVSSGEETNRLQFYNIGAATYDIASIRAFVGAGQANRGELGFYVNNGASQQLAMYIDRSQNVGIGTASPANTVKLDVVGDIRTSTGILFGTDTAAANLLDDYEEGTWTATVTGGTFSNLTVGRYTKIGRQVFACINPNTTAITGDIVISGLPFTAGSRSAMVGTGLPPTGVTYIPRFVDGATIVIPVAGTYAGTSWSTYFACIYEV